MKFKKFQKQILIQKIKFKKKKNKLKIWKNKQIPKKNIFNKKLLKKNI